MEKGGNLEPWPVTYPRVDKYNTTWKTEKNAKEIPYPGYKSLLCIVNDVDAFSTIAINPNSTWNDLLHHINWQTTRQFSPQTLEAEIEIRELQPNILFANITVLKWS